MSKGEVLEDYFPARELEGAKKYVEVYHGRFLLNNKLGRTSAVLLALYMLCNNKETGSVSKTDLTTFAKKQLGIELFSQGLHELKATGMVAESDTEISPTFKGLKKLREMLEVEVERPPTAREVAGEEAVPSIGGTMSVRAAILKLLADPKWGARPKNLAQLMNAFELNALYYPKGTVGTELKRMTKLGLLRRIRSESGYGYVLGPKAKKPV